MKERNWNIENDQGVATYVGRLDVAPTVTNWLEDEQPDYDDAVVRLISEIQNMGKREDLLLLANYIEEFYQVIDLRSMGWVGSDGLP